MVIFLRMNGVGIVFPDEEPVDDKMVDIANNKITIQELTDWLRDLCEG